MIELPRRQFLTGLVSPIVAPAIVRAGSLMPVRSFKITDYVGPIGPPIEILYGHMNIGDIITFGNNNENFFKVVAITNGMGNLELLK